MDVAAGCAQLRGVVVAPTATGPTWALMGEDTDTPNLNRIVEAVKSRWNIDPARMLLTGMSDGGTFCYVTGLEDTSPFTHLAPVSATFHPLMAEMASPDRLRGLPLYLVHGALDWMFPVRWRGKRIARLPRREPLSSIASSTISAIAIPTRSTRPCWRGCGESEGGWFTSPLRG